MRLAPGPGFSPTHAELAADLAAQLAELARMPDPRRAEAVQRLAPDLLELERVCVGEPLLPVALMPGEPQLTEALVALARQRPTTTQATAPTTHTAQAAPAAHTARATQTARAGEKP